LALGVLGEEIIVLKVSVIMPVFNGIRFLDRAIQSILNQTEKDLEFIIIDDGSTEAVFDRIKTYNDPRIRAFREDENKGLTIRLNQCLDLAKGEFIARMDADDESHPERISKQLLKFEQNIGFVGCWGQSFDEHGIAIRKYVDIHCRCTDDDLKNIYPKKLCMIDPSMIYSRVAVEKVGYFDPLALTGETYNYTRRVQQFFEGRVVQEILYYRTYRKDSVMRLLRTPIDIIALANQRAVNSPIIKEIP
jgi:glycosyltransferase involved in cell wall biosynthesis